MENQLLYTIGHSTRSQEEFLSLLHSFKAELLVDIRNFPGSRNFPHFNKDAMELWLPENDIEYVHLKELGGRRTANKDSKNTAWRHPAFRAYADYMQTDAFKTGTEKLGQLSHEKITAIMCSEAVWWRCHRSMVADYMKSMGWQVRHIMAENTAKDHPYTAPARIVDGKLTYEQD